jgi:uncharacterized protein (TIGR02266 family)
MIRARNDDLGTTERRPRRANLLPPERAPKSIKESSERRDRVRCEVHIDIDATSGEGSYSGVTRDLSESGVFIATELHRPVGTQVELALHLPNREQPLRCVGEVRWLRAANAEKDTQPGLGLRFVRLEPEARRRLQSFLAERVPAYGDD